MLFVDEEMSVAKEFEAANANYAASFAKGDLQLPPQRYGHLLLLETTPNKSQFNSKVAIVACMDARLGRPKKELQDFEVEADHVFSQILLAP